MKRYILLIFFAVCLVSIGGIFLFGSFRSKKSQTVEIVRKFEKDSAFVQDNLSDLPLMLYENKAGTKDYFVILISGDGGWRGFIDQVAKKMSSKGISVVGLNLVGYLDKEKSPSQIASDIHRIINNFSHSWKKQKVLIGGYSFGGEIIPFFFNQLNTEDQDKIDKIFFIAISSLADFKVSPIYYYNPKKSKPVLPEIQKINDEKFIFFCDNTNESICKHLPARNGYKVIQLNYNHLFLGHYKEVCDIIAKNVVE